MPARGPVFDADVLRRTARVHEASGFDRVLIGYFTNAPDGFIIGAQVAAATERLGLLVAHRPGFVAPTLAARKLATLDVATAGRAAVHIIAGGSDADQARDGDYVDHDARYRRSAEYIDVLRRTWSSREPFDHHGEFYRVDKALSAIVPVNGSSIPIYGGGGSDAAIADLAPRVDTFMVWGEPLADTEAFFDRVRAARLAAGESSPIGFSVSTRPILGVHRGCRLGSGAADPRRDPDAGGWPGVPAGRTSPRSGCWTARRVAKCSTAACGPRSPRRPGRPATPRRSSAPPRRWPRRWPTTPSSARPRC